MPLGILSHIHTFVQQNKYDPTTQMGLSTIITITIVDQSFVKAFVEYAYTFVYICT